MDVKWHIQTGLLPSPGRGDELSSRVMAQERSRRAGYMGFFDNWGRFGDGAERDETGLVEKVLQRRELRYFFFKRLDVRKRNVKEANGNVGLGYRQGEST